MIRAKGCCFFSPHDLAQIKELAEEMCLDLLGTLAVPEEHTCMDVNIPSSYSVSLT